MPNDQNFSEGIQQLEQGCAFAAIIASAERSVLFPKKMVSLIPRVLARSTINL